MFDGHELHFISDIDPSQTLAFIGMRNMNLYVVEGTVPEGQLDPGLFQRSLGWLDENGNAIRCQTLYHHAFPLPPSRREGQGQRPGLGRGGLGGSRSVPSPSVRLGPDLKVEEVPCVSLHLSPRHSP